jgi:tetratricopeptide (TPR) repeat protein
MKILQFIVVILLVLIVPFPILSQDTSSFMREGDVLWEKRGVLENAEASIISYKMVLEADANSYEACWKIARAYFFLGDMLPETKVMRSRHKERGVEGMRYAKKALELNPQGIEGHYYYTLSLAQYSIGISIIRALAKGLGPDYEEHIGKALEIDKMYDYAGPLRAVGRYWYKLPWPKRNIKKSIGYLEEAVASAPTNIRGHVYLAESYLKAKEKELAKEQLQKALEIVPNLKIEVDAKRWKSMVKELLKEKF